MSCKRCGCRLSTGQTVCNRCGGTQIERRQKHKCVYCGRYQWAGLRICSYCGCEDRNASFRQVVSFASVLALCLVTLGTVGKPAVQHLEQIAAMALPLDQTLGSARTRISYLAHPVELVRADALPVVPTETKPAPTRPAPTAVLVKYSPATIASLPAPVMVTQSLDRATPTPAPTDVPTLIAPRQAAAAPRAVVRADRSVNVRAGPGASFGVVGVAPVGAVYTISARNAKGDWLRLAGEAERWISASLVKVTGTMPPYGVSPTPVLGSLAPARPETDATLPPTIAAAPVLIASADTTTSADTTNRILVATPVSAPAPISGPREAQAINTQAPAAPPSTLQPLTPTATALPSTPLIQVNKAAPIPTETLEQAKTAHSAEPTAAPQAAKSEPMAVVGTDGANIRSGPGTEYDVVSIAPAGKTFQIVGRTDAGDWLRLEGSAEAWVSVGTVALSGQPPVIIKPVPAIQPAVPAETKPLPPSATVVPLPTATTASADRDADGGSDPAMIDETTTVPTAAATPTAFSATVVHPRGVNLRAGPGQDFDIVGTVRQGMLLDIVGCDVTGQWIRLAGDKERWLIKSAAQLSGLLPVVAAAR